MVSEARRLGISWELTLGTVADGAASLVTCDGDTEPIAVASMVGVLTTGDRVYVLQVPPSGNFVMGYASQRPTMYYRRIILSEAQASPYSITVPSNLSSLTITARIRTTYGGFAGEVLTARIAGSSAANYSYQQFQMSGAGTSVGAAFGQTSIFLGVCCTSAAVTNRFSQHTLELSNWDAKSGNFPTWNFRGSAIATASLAWANWGGGFFDGVAAPYESISFISEHGNSIAADSEFEIQGWYTL